MSFTGWLRSLQSVCRRGTTARKGRRAGRGGPANGLRLQLECLEGRTVPAFAAPVNYAVGSYPVAVVSADFDNDGLMDLAVANSNSSTLSVLLGNGNGTFQPALSAATGGGPLSVAVGDFNDDGNLDLATANLYDVSMLLGNGDGTFQAPTNIAIGSDPYSISVGDFNGDGNLDLGVTSGLWGGGGGDEGGMWSFANVLLGNGDGTFGGPHTTAGGGYQSAAVADFNGDSKLDFAAADGWVGVLLGNGAGNLLEPNYFDSGGFSGSIAAGDVNGDSKPDLFTANRSYYDDQISVLLGDGAGRFGPAQYYATGNRTYAWDVELADFNKDSNLDIATADSRSLTVLLGRGNGTFSPPFNSAVSYCTAVAAGDFNGDGWLDAVTANSGTNNISVLINDRAWLSPVAPSVTVNDVTVTEGNTGTRAASFTVTLSAASSQPVTVVYATANGTATAGSDYQAVSSTLTIPAGQTTGTITVQVNGDRVAEPNETFVVNLSNATNATIADGQGLGTIIDDEPRISISDVTKAEGKKGQTTLFTFTVTLSAVYDQPVTMSFQTVNGTAKTSDNDYIAKTRTLTFAPGQTTKTITIEVKGDSKKEADETFYLDLFGLSSNALFTKSRGLGTILNDD